MNSVIFDVPGFEGMKYFFYFYAVGADVLHRCGADASGDEAEIFHAGEIVLDTILYKPMPALPCPGLQVYIAVIFGDLFHTADPVVKDQAIDVTGEKDVAAAAEDHGAFAGEVEEIGQAVCVFEAGEVSG